MVTELGLSRRAFGGLLGGVMLTGCATAPPAHPWPSHLARGRVSEDLIDRVTVGLRPGRRGGFRLEAEALGSKWLIHNYGHQGFGVSLSWGSSEMAADLAPPLSGQAVAVLGAGIVGLSNARIAQERGAKVTVYARELPPHTTSNMSGGQWWPNAPEGTDPAYHALFREAATRAFSRFRQMAHTSRYGVWWQDNWLFRAPPGPETRGLNPATRWLRDLVTDYTPLIEPGRHPFGDRYMTYYRSLQVEPGRHLDALMRDIREAGGQIVQRGFANLDEVAALPQPIIFNCTGVGAGALMGDINVFPIRGQLVVLRPQPRVNYNMDGFGAYIFSRPDGLLLGGTFQANDWRLEPDPQNTQSILRAAARGFPMIV